MVDLFSFIMPGGWGGGGAAMASYTTDTTDDRKVDYTNTGYFNYTLSLDTSTIFNTRYFDNTSTIDTLNKL